MVSKKPTTGVKRTVKGPAEFRYWIQQPITWGLVLGGGFLFWQLLETLSLQNRVEKNTNQLKAIEESGQAADINVERRLQSLQSNTSALDKDRESLKALRAADEKLESRLGATEDSLKQLDRLSAADQDFNNQLQVLRSKVDAQAEQLAKANENLAKVRKLQSDLEDALRRLGEAEDRFEAVQEVYQSLSDAQKYIPILQESSKALAAAQDMSDNIVYKDYLTDQLTKKKDEILKVVRELFAQQSAASALLNPDVSSLRGTLLWEPLTKVAIAVGTYATLIQEKANSGPEWDAAWKQLGTAVTEYSDQAKARLQQVGPAKVEAEGVRIKRLLKSTGKVIITSILGANSSKAIKDFNDEVDRRWLKQVGDSTAPSQVGSWVMPLIVLGTIGTTAFLVWWNWGKYSKGPIKRTKKAGRVATGSDEIAALHTISILRRYLWSTPEPIITDHPATGDVLITWPLLTDYNTVLDLGHQLNPCESGLEGDDSWNPSYVNLIHDPVYRGGMGFVRRLYCNLLRNAPLRIIDDVPTGMGMDMLPTGDIIWVESGRNPLSVQGGDIFLQFSFQLGDEATDERLPIYINLPIWIVRREELEQGEAAGRIVPPLGSR